MGINSNLQTEMRGFRDAQNGMSRSHKGTILFPNLKHYPNKQPFPTQNSNQLINEPKSLFKDKKASRNNHPIKRD